MTEQNPNRDALILVAAKARWEAACEYHRAAGLEHPTWDEIGTGDWSSLYPKYLLLAWEAKARDAYENALRERGPTEEQVQAVQSVIGDLMFTFKERRFDISEIEIRATARAALIAASAC